jgi:UDP-N-acetylmuramyl pentapeptide synthase
MLGRVMVYPILAAIAVAGAEGVPLDDAIGALEALQPTARRLEPVTLPNGAVLLRDDHKTAHETIEAAFDVAAGIPARRRILVMGSIDEPIGPQRRWYRHFGERSASIFSSAVLLTGHSFTSFVAGAKERGAPKDAMVRVRNVQEAVRALPEDLGPGDFILVKGTAAQRLERLALALKGRVVLCDVPLCDVKMVRCEHCAMLARGWEGRRPPG